MDFYDDLLVQLLAALGAALFVGNGLALIRRRSDRSAAAAGRRRGGARPSAHQSDDDLAQAPVARTVLYMVIGFVVMAAAVGSLVA
ncbi:MAG: hypothetical protein R3A49_11730 [Acidimicrobiia bacterium]